MVDVVQELEALRQNLLDLSLRNNLLNYRPSQRRTLSIAGRTPAEVYELFVLQEKSMKFRAKARSKKSKKAGNGEVGEDDTAENESKLLKAIGRILTSEEKSKTTPSRFEPFLDTPDDSETLERKLFYVHNQANSIFEEQGYPVLYLALGFLQWNDTRSSVKNPRAPLVLIPVELKRIGKGRNFNLQWTGDEIFTSITLQAKMKEMGIEVPEFEMPEEASGIEEYFKAVQGAIREKPDWKLLSEICLDLFNFRKFVMYKDLDPSTWPEDMSPAEHPLVQKIFNPTEPECNVPGFLEEEVDLKLSVKDTYHILDADSSQIAVMEDAKAGKDLVVEGPPGTGKSQTIANTIGELLAQGRSVLFVSEKMAALQVVKSRLDAAGLGELCLEIHSHQTRKKAVLEALEKALNRPAPQAISPDRDINELEKLKRELNEYALTLGEPAGKLYSSLYTLYGVREKNRAYFEARGLKMPRFDLKEPETWELEAWTEAESVLEKLGRVLPALGPVRKNPWYGCEPGLVLPSDLGELEPLAEDCAAAFEALEKTIKTLNELSASSKPQSLEGVRAVIGAAKLAAGSKPLPEAMLQNAEWESEASKAEAAALVSKLRQYLELKAFVDKTFYPAILDLDTSEFEKLSHKLLKQLNPKYRKLKKDITACYAFGAPKDSQILLDLACLSECETRRFELEGAQSKGKKYFGEYWKGFESDPVFLEEYGRWIIPFRKYVKEGVFTDRVFKLVTGGVEEGKFEPAINEVLEAKKAFLDSLENFGARVGADFTKMFGTGLENVKISQLKSRVTRWKAETPSLVFWSQFLGYRQACLDTLAAPMMEEIEAGKIEPEDMIPAFEGNYAETLLHRAFKERPALSTFIRELHEGKINKFTELDRKVLLENRKRIIHSAYEETPKLTSGASRASEAGILLNEFNRKRGHMPIRTLMKKSGGLVQKIKPCFMMSPLSIAQYLDPRSTRFDVIIFDEASQVRPEDAVGALLRGKQVVVMGDSKQLPPTTFFDTVIDAPESEPDDYAAAGDMESILNVCKRSFPIKTLRWHYRSRHESLIAVSNQEFYDNRLYVYPSPMQKDERLGLKFVHLPDAVYDRGKSGANREEARAVARAVFEHFRRYPDKSLGVGTFNVKQQEAVQEEIEALIKASPGVDLNSGNERGEHFFVKNLETIQGDERDVILLSVGFGFDNNRKLSLNFGPLNREGGERRLNVLITRAREKCVVFANFTSRDLHLDENSSFGLRALKVFLEFAESGRLLSPACGREDAESPFEEAVSDFLTENGCEVHRQIGCAGYRLDLAVPDPRHPGRYILGIECDGAGYHSSPVARDRDRLRQQVLEGLGWKLYRVWSTDWYLHPKESREKLLEAVKAAVEQARLEAPEPETQPETQPETGAEEVYQPFSWNDTSKESSGKKVHPDAAFLTSGRSEKVEKLKGPETSSMTEYGVGPEEGLKVEGLEAGEGLEIEALQAGDGLEVEEEELEAGGGEEDYSSPFSELELNLSGPAGTDFLPEMTSKAAAMASLADENSRKRPVRRSGKSKLLKFNVEPRTITGEDTEGEFEPIPEPEPERLNFYQAYPDVDFMASPVKKRKGKRINEFAYIYGSGGFFEPESDSEEEGEEEDNSISGPEVKPGTKMGPEFETKAEIETEFETETKPLQEPEQEIDPDPEALTLQAFWPEKEAEMEGKNDSTDSFTQTDYFTLKPETLAPTKRVSEALYAANAGTDEPEGPEKPSGKEGSSSGKEESLEALVPPYRVCLSPGLPKSGDLSEVPDEELIGAVVTIVECEGPVHEEELLQRIKLHCEIPRMAGKIKTRIFDSVASAGESGEIRIKGEFLWPVSGPSDLLRRREGDTAAKIEWICDEEILEAVRFVLNSQYSTPLEDLVIQASRVLGIRTTRKNTKERIEALILSGIESNELTRMPNEMIYFAE
ncbi:DUF3320 domain-containing protein [Methanosarcina sp. KYL-1]|uniref:DUF3320 domain-containing protein n=1 Tax=Methanosarcina sp. KYL-1 TaxID=2602068 RepID=UPI002100CD55|nr:DUF3320 domain-containing protein [Methanosarcina sp. KYL-1]MCQ1536433.1 DUF3320 domain-containing protein [Methanosarcina sp. KYL-1]